jgi:hypothetical protein
MTHVDPDWHSMGVESFVSLFEMVTLHVAPSSQTMASSLVPWPANSYEQVASEHTAVPVGRAAFVRAETLQAAPDSQSIAQAAPPFEPHSISQAEPAWQL